MAQIWALGICVCVGFLLLAAGCEGGLTSAALSDSESYFDKCESIKCPEIPETEADALTDADADAMECPADSSIDATEFDDIQLNPLQFNQDTRAKRDLQSICCVILPRCRCNKCPKRPQCKADEVLIELTQGTGQPGSCCTQYKCGKEPQCEDIGQNYWLNKCTKCNSCKPPCINVCYQSDQGPPSNCLTDDNEFKLNGETWLQGHGCVNCICLDGNTVCQESSCKPPECKNPIKLPDACCPICPVETSTTAVTATTAANATTEAAVVQSSTTSLDITSEAIESSTTEQTKDEGVKQSVEQPEEVASMISSSTSESNDESTIATELSNVEEATEKSIEAEIPVSVNTDVLLDAFQQVEQYETITLNSLETDVTSSSSVPETETSITDNIEMATEPAMDNLEMDSSSISNSASSPTSAALPSTTERPGALATSAPAALTPESTSFHRDEPIDDKDYRIASPNDAIHSTNLLYIMNPFIIITCGIIVGATVIIVCIRCQRRKGRYCSVPHSDCNLSENTNSSDLVLYIDQPDDNSLPQKPKQLNESVMYYIKIYLIMHCDKKKTKQNKTKQNTNLTDSKTI